MENKNITFEKIEEHLLKDKKPSLYFNSLLEKNFLNKVPLNYLKKLKDIPQSKEHHPEGDVWNHTMLVIDNGATYREFANNKKVFMWSLLLHDIGKIYTTKLRKGRWTSYNHDRVGEEKGREFLKELGIKDEEMINKVGKLIKYHMHFLYITKELPFGNEEEMIKEVDINDISLVFLCDRLGRGNLSKDDKLDIIASIHEFLEAYKEKNYDINFIRK